MNDLLCFGADVAVQLLRGEVLLEGLGDRVDRLALDVELQCEEGLEGGAGFGVGGLDRVAAEAECELLDRAADPGLVGGAGPPGQGRPAPSSNLLKQEIKFSNPSNLILYK